MKSKLLGLAGLALSLLGTIISFLADDKKNEERVAKYVANKLK